MKLAIASQKGGVGKSTICLNLAVAFAESGQRVVVVDTDPQGALNLTLGKGSSEYPGLADLFSGDAQLDDVLVSTKLSGLTLLTKGRLNMVDVPLFEKEIYAGELFKQTIDTLNKDADLVMFDTPAGLGMITRAVFRLADHVLVPFKVDMLNLRSVHQVIQVIEAVQQQENPQLAFLGIVLNMFERENDDAFQVAGEIWRDFPAVLDTTIPHVDIFARANRAGVPVSFLGKSKHPEARRFAALAEELLALMEQPGEADDEHVRQLL